jgi:hypothetical protein
MLYSSLERAFEAFVRIVKHSFRNRPKANPKLSSPPHAGFDDLATATTINDKRFGHEQVSEFDWHCLDAIANRSHCGSSKLRMSSDGPKSNMFTSLGVAFHKRV